MFVETNSLHEAKSLRLDSSKILNLLKWSPTYSTEEIINDTVNWYQAYNTNPKTIHDFTVSLIENYVCAARKSKKIWTKTKK